MAAAAVVVAAAVPLVPAAAVVHQVLSNPQQDPTETSYQTVR